MCNNITYHNNYNYYLVEDQLNSTSRLNLSKGNGDGMELIEDHLLMKADGTSLLDYCNENVTSSEETKNNLNHALSG